MHPNCIPDIMILAQAVLQIFMSQDYFNIQNASQKRDIIQSNIHKNFPNVNQVLYTFDTNCRISWSYRNDPKFLDRQAWANSADPDQTAPRGAVWSGSTLFAIPSASFGLITLW